jgi:hypothetical protein
MPEYNLGDLLDAAADVNFVHPDGKYDAIVKTAAYKLSSKGNHMAVAQFKVITGPYRDKPVTIRHNFVLSPDSPRALDMLFQQLSNLGIPQTWFQQRRGIGGQELMEQLAAVLVNRVGYIETKSDREFNGRKQIDIKWINPPTDAGKKAAGVPAKPSTPSTPQAAPSATETPATPEAAQPDHPNATEPQDAAQPVEPSVTDNETANVTEHPDVTAAKAAADAGTGPELPF